jgi:ABC-type antimicrobial peptide transport system permease subunit
LILTIGSVTWVLGANEKYVPNYSRQAVAYNADNDDNNDAGVSLFPHKDIYDIYGIYDDTPSQFDVLDATKLAQVLKSIHKKYR